MLEEFTFETTPGTRKYCEWVLFCLKKYFGVPTGDGAKLLNGFFANQGVTRFDEDNFWLHEDPYAIAELLYLGPSKADPGLVDDPRRIAPQEFRDLYYGRRTPEGHRTLGGEIPWDDVKE